MFVPFQGLDGIIVVAVASGIYIGNQEYFADGDGVFRIKLANKVSTLNREAKIVVNKDLPAGSYTIRYTLFASDDGIVRGIKIKKNYESYLIKQYEKSDSRILCITYENSNNNIFYTGHSNGNICKWNYDNGSILLTLTNPKINKKDNSIWSINSIDSQFLLCGDSLGKLLIYDIKLGILIKEFNEHKAPILSIISNKSIQNPIAYFTGADSLLCSIKYDRKNNIWILTSSFRGQSHDINSLSMINNDTLISGGVTTDICIYHLSKGGNLYMK